MAHARVSQARARFDQFDLDGAEQLAGEAAATNFAFAPGEDSPKRIKADVANARNDTKWLLAAARAAMKRNDLDKAEAYAKLSAKQSGLFDYPLWASDNPSQALKDIQEARKKAAASVTSPPRTDNAITQASAKAEPAPQAPPARPPAAAPASPAPAPAPVVAQAVLTKDEAVAQLKHGRAQLEAGMLDDAGAVARRLRGLNQFSWGLFEDNPEKLQGDVDKARHRHQQDESVKLLAEARRLYEKKEYEAATRAAQQSATLHGPYSIWDFGDQPAKLLAEIDAARARNQASPPPAPAPTALAGTQGSQTPPASPANEDQARKWLTEARTALNNNDTQKARQLADRVAQLGKSLNRPEADSLAVLYGDIDAAVRVLVPVPPAPSSLQQATGASNPVVAAPVPPPVSWPGQPLDDGTQPPDSAKVRARALMAEARRLQKEDKLIEAAQVIARATELRVKYGPFEETPDVVLAQLASRAAPRSRRRSASPTRS